MCVQTVSSEEVSDGEGNWSGPDEGQQTTSVIPTAHEMQHSATESLMKLMTIRICVMRTQHVVTWR